ncbi:MAG: hypothetical protein WD075_10515 [Rhodospirillales bacterium]
MKQSVLLRTIGFSVVLSVLLLAEGAVSHASDQLQLKRSFGLRGDGESHVQMRSMLAPVRRNKNTRSSVSIPVTPVLTVVTKDMVGHVCKLGPRISDALLQSWHAEPMTLGYIFDPDKSAEKAYRIAKTEEQKAEDSRLIAAVNNALGDALVSDILVIKGTRQMGGGAISKLPFASVLGCTELEKSAPAPEEKKTH